MRAAAFVVGPREGNGGALIDLARSMGFQFVARYRDLDEVDRQLQTTPLVYFLFAATPRLNRLRHTTTAIRKAPDSRIRFAPMVYVAPQLGMRTIGGCVAMGFDDVITLPFTYGDLAARLFRHVGTPTSYYETATYFGPDRRTQFGTAMTRATETNPGAHTRYDLVRSAELGVTVMQIHETLAPPPLVPDRPTMRDMAMDDAILI